MRNVIKNLLADKINESIEKWIESNTEETIEKVVFSELDKARKIVTLSFLGFDEDFGRRGWKVDHCNGRAGNSFVGQAIRSLVQQSVEKWIQNNITFENLDLTSVKKEIEKAYIEQLKREASCYVQSEAKLDIEDIVKDHLSSLDDIITK